MSDDRGNGCLGKIGAHRLFAWVFRKRLAQTSLPPPPPLPPDADGHRRDMQVKTVPVSAPREQEVMVSEGQGPALSFTELEKILRQKTLTRSEIDGLTALLHARTSDIPDLEGGKIEDLPLKPVKGKEASSDILGQDNENKSRLIKTHVVDGNDASSPGELAGALMGHRPATVSSCIPGSQVHSPRKDSTILSYSQHTAKSSSVSLEMVHDSSRLEHSVGTSMHDAGQSTSHKQDKVEQHGLDDEVKSVDADSEKSHAHPTLEKNQGFKMSAVDFSDLDDDDGYSNEEATNSPDEDREILHSPTSEQKQAVSVSAKGEKSPALLVLQAGSDVETNDTSSLGGKSSCFSFPSDPLVPTIVQSDTQAALSTLTSDKPSSEGQSNAVSAIFNDDNKELNAATPVFGFGLNSGSITEDTSKIPQFSFASSSSLAGSSTLSFGISSDSKAGSTNSFSVAVQDSTTFPAKVPELDKSDDKNLKDGKISASPEIAISASASVSASSSTPTFSFGFVPPKSAILSRSVSLPVSFNSIAAAVQKSSRSLPFSATSSSSNSSTAEISMAAIGSLSTSVPASSILQFGSSMSTSASLEPSASSASSASALEVKPKGSDFGNATSNPFSGQSSVNATVGSAGFGFSAPAADAQKQGSSLSSAPANGSAQMSTFTQNAPIQSGSSAPSFSFGLSGNTTLATGNSLFGSLSAPKLFAGSSFGMSFASSPEANSATSGSSNASNLFGYWQSSSSPVFGTSTSSASHPTPFSFRSSTSWNSLIFGSSAPSSASSRTSLSTSTDTTSASNGATVFGSNATWSTPCGASVFGSASTFSFASAASSAASQSLLENPNPVFTFSGQQPVTPPSAGFMFANPSQFGAQQNLATPLNQSPFQPFGNLDFSAGAGGTYYFHHYPLLINLHFLPQNMWR